MNKKLSAIVVLAFAACVVWAVVMYSQIMLANHRAELRVAHTKWWAEELEKYRQPTPANERSVLVQQTPIHFKDGPGRKGGFTPDGEQLYTPTEGIPVYLGECDCPTCQEAMKNANGPAPKWEGR